MWQNLIVGLIMAAALILLGARLWPRSGRRLECSGCTQAQNGCQGKRAHKT